MSSSAQRGGTCAGFTLVELLVAFTLLGLLALLFLGALQFGARVWDRSLSHGQANNETRLVQNLLRRQLERSGARTIQPSEAVRFSGNSDQLSFVAPFPAAAVDPRLYLHRLGLRANGVTSQLILELRPLDASDLQIMPPDENEPTPTWDGNTQVLLEDVTEFEATYWGEGDAPGWQAQWQEQSPPPLVRLRLTLGGDATRAWPDLIVAPHLAPPSQSKGE